MSHLLLYGTALADGWACIWAALHYGFGRKTTTGDRATMQMVPTLVPVEGGLALGVAGLL